MILGNLGKTRACRGAKQHPARNPKLPSHSLGYRDDILMLTKSGGVQKMEVYGRSYKKIDFLAQKNGPKTCLGASPAKLLTQKSPYLPHFNYCLG